MITLSSKRLMVKEITKRTQARLFSGLRVGDVITITMKVKHPGYGRALYTTRLDVASSTGETAEFSLPVLSKVVQNFKWEEQEDECAVHDAQDPSY